jgi:2-C-methyl-D-erythritol 2,4-cyclodiphosphate synthase
MALLAEVVSLVTADGWDVANVDVTVVAEAPRIAPHRAALEQRLTGAVGGPVHEGIACWAVALLQRP